MQPEIKVDVFGEGKPLLLIHGFLEKGDMWEFLLPRLEGRTVIIPDLPGHGESDLLEEDATLELYASVCLDILDQVNEGPVDIIGHSMGGYIACAIAELEPERVASLVLMNSTARADDPEKKKARDRAMEVVQQDKKKYNRGMISGLFAEGKQEFADVIDRLVYEANEMSEAAIVSALAAMRDRKDSVKMLSERTFPLAYLLGDKDARLPIDTMEEECDQIQPDEVCILEGIGHMSQFEAPKVSADFIEHWYAAIARS